MTKRQKKTSKVKIYRSFFFRISLCLNYKSFSKRFKKQTTKSLVYVVSCLTSTIINGQMLKIITLLASDLPNNLINTMMVRNHLAQKKMD